jgi:two-component system, sensor histidine kinase FlrB
MAASLAHQIRTPLSAAVLYASHLGKEQLPSGDRARFADRLSDRLRNLERLVNDMLAFARGGSSGAERFSVKELLDDFQLSIDGQLQAAGARWRVCNAVPDALILGNKDALIGALGNLVTNSLQLITGLATLELDVLGTGRGEIELRLRDNGPGIPAGIRERIFDPFFTTRPGGTGLGLAVVQATLRAHQGDVQVATPAAGGTEFILHLPNLLASVHLPSGLRTSYLTTAMPAVGAACGIN